METFYLSIVPISLAIANYFYFIAILNGSLFGKQSEEANLFC